MEINKYVWKITVGDIYLGTTDTDNRFNLIKECVDKGLIPANYNITDVKFEIVKSK